MTASAPLVSVVMPVYQAARWVAEATESILSQSHRDLELIALDDGSTDASLEILEGFAARDPRVRVVRREHAGVISTCIRKRGGSGRGGPSAGFTSRNAGGRNACTFLMHVGKPQRSKGTALLTALLPRIWAEEPHFRLVVAGVARESLANLAGGGLAARDERVLALGPLEKADLYAALSRAKALVQPSLVDNLPNTVIESLLLGVPVIAFDGVSLDELIEPGVTGELVPVGNPEALAAALLRVWRGDTPARKGFTWHAAIAQEMRPDFAVRGLLDLAGLTD